MKILLVDDDVFLRDMYATKFTESGHEVDSADSAAAALKKIGADDFDVLLLDMIMPGMSGTELMQTIAEEHPNKKAKSIILSNQGQEADMEEAKAAGAIGYIVKAEVVPTEVVTEVERLMSNTQ